jgi:ribosomal protein S12 methylthiotransferase accessory factor
MEGIERVSAENVPSDRIISCSFDQLIRTMTEGSVIDPLDCDLPFLTTYRADREISWVAGYDIAAESDVWIAADLVLSPPREGVCHGVETTGLASGNTITEAVLHALYELVERDSLAAETFTHMHGEPTDPYGTPLRLIDPDAVPPAAQPLIERLSGRGLSVRIQDLTSDLDIPVFGVLVIDGDFPGMDGEPVSFSGYGADLDAARALIRALTEAAQGHAIVLLGARDTFEGTRPLPDRTGMLLRRATIHHGPARAPFPATKQAPDDLRMQVDIVVARLRAQGLMRAAVADLTRPDLGVPVVRVVVPGLAFPYGASCRRPGRRLLARIL